MFIVDGMNDLGTNITRIICLEDNRRIDAYLAENLSGLSRNAVQKLLNAGQVSCHTADSQVIYLQKNHHTSSGEIYIITQDEPEPPNAKPQEIPLVVIYEDTDIIVINKQKGLVVHPAPGHPDGTLVNALLAHCGNSLSGIGGVKRPGIIHRLDKDTSGIIIAAKNDNAHISLADQLSNRSITRAYDAIVCGNIKSNSGTIDAPIGRSQSDRKRQSVTDKNSRNAVTRFDVVARYASLTRKDSIYTHVRCSLVTGRTHQIRVHMAHIGFPILGDSVYGRKKPELGQSSQCLHAGKVRFIHPSTNKEIELTAPLPEYFVNVLSKLKVEN